MATNGSSSSLAVESRSKSGTTISKALRKAGKIPAVLFGHGADPMPVSLDAKAFDALLHSGGKNRLLHLDELLHRYYEIANRKIPQQPNDPE